MNQLAKSIEADAFLGAVSLLDKVEDRAGGLFEDVSAELALNVLQQEWEVGDAGALDQSTLSRFVQLKDILNNLPAVFLKLVQAYLRDFRALVFHERSQHAECSVLEVSIAF